MSADRNNVEDKPCIIQKELLQGACRCETRKNDWLQNGYKIPEEPVDEAKYVGYLDEKRIESAFYHRVSRAEARVGLGAASDFVFLAHSSVPVRPTMWFLVVGSGVCLQKFLVPTSGSLRIPPYGRYPCLRLTLPAGECIADFHYQVVALPGAPRKNWGLSFATVPLFLFWNECELFQTCPAVAVPHCLPPYWMRWGVTSLHRVAG